MILALEDGRLRYRGHGEVASNGWSKGRLADQQALTACVRAAVREAEVEAQRVGGRHGGGHRRQQRRRAQ